MLSFLKPHPGRGARNAARAGPEFQPIVHSYFGQLCSGRRWPEGPDEGTQEARFCAFPPPPRASRHPLPEGEGTRRKEVSDLESKLHRVSSPKRCPPSRRISVFQAG